MGDKINCLSRFFCMVFYIITMVKTRISNKTNYQFKLFLYTRFYLGSYNTLRLVKKRSEENMENRKKKEPLLYIAQPTFSKPQPFMQENYSSLTRQKDERAHPVIKEQPKRKKHRKINPFFEIDEQEDLSIAEEDEQAIHNQSKDNQHDEHEHIKSKAKDVKFNDLSIQEKIDYFINLPKEMPKMKSEIELKEDVYQGYILKDIDDEIVFKTGRLNKTVKKTDINNIILLGF